MCEAFPNADFQTRGPFRSDCVTNTKTNNKSSAVFFFLFISFFHFSFSHFVYPYIAKTILIALLQKPLHRLFARRICHLHSPFEV